MGVTFRKHTDVSSTKDVTLYARELKRSFTSKSQLNEIKGKNHLLIPMGKKGPFISWDGHVNTLVDYNNIDNWNSGDFIDIISSSYPEIKVGEVWYIDKVTTSRKAAMLDRWEISLTIVKIWSHL